MYLLYAQYLDNEDLAYIRKDQENIEIKKYDIQKKQKENNFYNLVPEKNFDLSEEGSNIYNDIWKQNGIKPDKDLQINNP